MKARAAINSQRGDLTLGKWNDSHETTILYTYGGKLTLINSMDTKLPCFTSLPTRERCTWNTSPMHVSRMDNDVSQKITCFANRCGQPSHSKSFSKAAGIDTTQLRKTMFKKTDTRYESQASSSAGQSTWRKPNDNNSFFSTDLILPFIL